MEDVDDENVKLVHETSVKHYKDDMMFTLTDKVWTTWFFAWHVLIVEGPVARGTQEG